MKTRFLHEMADRKRGTPIHFYEIKGKDHFSGLQPASIIIAKRIMADSLSFEDALFVKAGKKTVKELGKKED